MSAIAPVMVSAPASRLATASPPATASDIPQPILRLIGVSKTFNGLTGTLEALQPVHLDVRAGEFVCLLGPSGCGKSTLLNLVAGLEAPTTGQVIANGKPVTGPGPDRALIFQDGALFPWLDVRGNVEFGLRQAGLSKHERRRIAQRWIDAVHLSGFERSFTHELSGGMRQRVAIARALAIDPDILLMDEPFGALDAMTRDLMHRELEGLWQTTRKTVLFVTHNVREAVALGDRVLVLAPRPGRIIAEFVIDLPRPRSLEDHGLVDQARRITAVLRESSAEGHQTFGQASGAPAFLPADALANK
ncbi:MAG: ABC transporter ATP-binding protein [Anaerolineae bacterium]|nr:ABC transporter ATP-binding protein [Thermoflexales bacterium]MDW8407298.1 ABC transporter ATP-binding protein [Anaerolineae bacterium]